MSSDEEKASSVEKETVDHKANKRLEEENKELKVGVTDGELVISELMEENAALKAEIARLEKELALAWAPSVFWS